MCYFVSTVNPWIKSIIVFIKLIIDIAYIIIKKYKPNCANKTKFVPHRSGLAIKIFYCKMEAM